MQLKDGSISRIFDQESTYKTRLGMDYIEISGYKSIRHAKVEIKPINILIGGNGAGKSNFISFFEFLERLASQRLQNHVALKGGMDKFLFQGQKITDEISGHISFENQLNEYSFKLVQGNGSFIVEREGLWYNGSESYYMVNGPEAEIKLYDAYRANYIRDHLSRFRIYHFHDTGSNSPFTKMSHIGKDVFYLYGKGDNLAAYLYAIRQNSPQAYRLIGKTIESVAPFFQDFFLEPNENGYLELFWRDKYSEAVYDASDFSDGTLRFIALCTLFLQPKLPSTIIIDEPELGLHPQAIEKLAGLIQSAAARGAQVIASTQSYDLVSCFNAEDIIAVDQKEGESHFERLNDKDFALWMDDYSLGDLWKQNIIAKGQPIKMQPI